MIYQDAKLFIKLIEEHLPRKHSARPKHVVEANLCSPSLPLLSECMEYGEIEPPELEDYKNHGR